jgi:uncharacterized protein (DUF924 family)
MDRIEFILDFWFGKLTDDTQYPKEHAKMWFMKSEQTDRLIHQNFEIDLQKAAQNKLDSWKETAKGALALVLLLDQFSRNIYRDTPKSFAQDSKALETALEAIHKGLDKKVRPIQRVFFYLPFEHSEDLEMQKQSVALCNDLVKTAPPELEKVCTSFKDYALHHFEIIQKFGRFPHRNKILGRPSTPEEIEFLKQPGSSF